MAIDYAQEAISLGNLFQQIAGALSDFIDQNVATLDQSTLTNLAEDQAQILSFSDKFFSLGDKITFAGDAQYFAKVDQATQAINANLHTIQQTDKWIGFAANVISLGLSIASGNGGGILTAVQGIAGALNISI